MISKSSFNYFFVWVTFPIALFSFFASHGVIFGLNGYGDYQIYTDFFYNSTHFSQENSDSAQIFGNIFLFIASFFYRYITPDHLWFFFSLSFFSLYIKALFIFKCLKNTSFSLISTLIYIFTIAVFFENIRIRASISISLAIICFLFSISLNRFIQVSRFRYQRILSAVCQSIFFYLSALAVLDLNITGFFFLVILFFDHYIPSPFFSKKYLSRLNPKQITLCFFVFSLIIFICFFLAKTTLLSMTFLYDTPLGPYAFKLGNDYIPKFLLFFVILILFIRSMSLVTYFSRYQPSLLPFSFVLIPASLGLSLSLNQYLFYGTLECVFYYMLTDVNIWFSSNCRNLLFLFSTLYFSVRVLPLLIFSI